jgi:hypothetical protein
VITEIMMPYASQHALCKPKDSVSITAARTLEAETLAVLKLKASAQCFRTSVSSSPQVPSAAMSVM